MNSADTVAFTRTLPAIVQHAIAPYLTGDLALHTEAKSDASPVTAADKAIELALRTAIREHYPHHRIIGEEMASEGNRESEYQWVIDPIDGTKAFLGGIPTFCTLVALVRKSSPILGMIYQPITGEMWVGSEGKLFTEKVSLAIREKPVTLAQAMLGTTDPFLSPDAEREAYLKLRRHCQSAICGGDAYLYAKLASGRAPHLVMESGLKLHDAMALIPVIEAAGGVATQWDGQPILADRWDSTILAAQNPHLHQEAIAILRQ